jgi:hypothetical protein
MHIYSHSSKKKIIGLIKQKKARRRRDENGREMTEINDLSDYSEFRWMEGFFVGGV